MPQGRIFENRAHYLFKMLGVVGHKSRTNKRTIESVKNGRSRSWDVNLFEVELQKLKFLGSK